MRPALIAAAALALLSLAAHAQAPPAGTRSEVPLREVDLSDATRRYALPIMVGGTKVEAGLDTGSPGLRLLPRAYGAHDVAPSGGRETIAYGAGVLLDGRPARARVTVGGLSAEIAVQLVEGVRCTGDNPTCPAGRIPFAKYGIQGDGLPGEGFAAIAGVLGGASAVPGLLQAVGAKRWIVELPRPGEAAGRIVLNPTDDEVAGFTRIPLAGVKGVGLADGVPGCVRSGGRAVCGVVTFDSGAPGVRILLDGPAPDWDGKDATLELGPQNHPLTGLGFTYGRRAQATKPSFAPRLKGVDSDIIRAGLLPYFAWSVLYAPGSGAVGVKARPVYPDGPVPAG